MGIFGAAQGWGLAGREAKGLPLSNHTYHTYHTIIKLGTVMPYLKKIQKIHKSRDTSLEFS